PSTLNRASLRNRLVLVLISIGGVRFIVELDQAKAVPEWIGKGDACRSHPLHAIAFLTGPGIQRALCCDSKVIDDKVQMHCCPVSCVLSLQRACRCCGAACVFLQQINPGGGAEEFGNIAVDDTV